MRVLVLEEAAPIRERIVAMLVESLGVDVIGEAPSSVRPERSGGPTSDVVIVDPTKLPGGLDLLGELKRGDRAPMIVVLTNHASEHHRQRVIRSGADFCFDKSKQLSCVVEVLREHRARLASAGGGP